MNWRDLFFSSEYDIDRLDNRDEAFIERVLGLASALKRWHQAEVRGVERIPTGSGLYVGNHNAGPMTCDSWLFGAAVLKERGLVDVPFGLGHEWAIRIRGVHPILVKVGAVRACHENAHRLFQAGHKVLVYPGGDVDSCRPFNQRHEICFDGRTGYVRLAIREGVPIIPVVASGAQSTWLVISDMRWLARAIGLDRTVRMKVVPLALTIPWGLTLGFPPPYLPFPSRILIEILEPIYFEQTGAQAAEDAAYVSTCARRVETAMQGSLDRLKVERRRRRRLPGLL